MWSTSVCCTAAFRAGRVRSCARVHSHALRVVAPRAADRPRRYDLVPRALGNKVDENDMTSVQWPKALAKLTTVSKRLELAWLERAIKQVDVPPVSGAGPARGAAAAAAATAAAAGAAGAWARSLPGGG